MREIKFIRYFFDEEKKVVHKAIWGKVKSDRRIISSCELSFTSPSVVGKSESWIDSQYTGLKDCKGKEIFEGDIVKPYSLEKTKNLSVIVYEFNEFRIKGVFLYWNWDLRQVEVVGNIYENPELSLIILE